MIESDIEGRQVREDVRLQAENANMVAVRDGAWCCWRRTFAGWWVDISVDGDLDGDPAAPIWAVSAASGSGSGVSLSRTMPLREAITAALQLPPPLAGSSVSEHFDTAREALLVDGVVRSQAAGRR